jgi:hypothetical protein
MPPPMMYYRRIWSSKIYLIAASLVLLFTALFVLLKFSPKAPIPEQRSPTPRLEKHHDSPNSQPAK